MKRDSSVSELKIFKVTFWVAPDTGEFFRGGVQELHSLPGKLFRFTKRQGMYANYFGNKVILWMYLDGAASESSTCRPPVFHFWKCKTIPQKLTDEIEAAGFGASSRSS